MARRRNSKHDGPNLFQEQEQLLTRRLRRQRALFIPRFLTEAASHNQLRGAAQDKAYEIALRWAELETNGHLPKYKETSIDTQFLDQLFGEGLGYQVKTTSPDAWQLEHKFAVPGVGIGRRGAGRVPEIARADRGGRAQGSADRSGPRSLQRPDGRPAMLGLSQRVAGMFVGDRFQFRDDSTVSP